MKNKYLKIAVSLIVGCAILNYLVGFLILSTVDDFGSRHNLRPAPFIDAAILPIVNSAQLGQKLNLQVYKGPCYKPRSSDEFILECEPSYYASPTLTIIGWIIAFPAYFILLLVESLIFVIISKILLIVARAIISLTVIMKPRS